MRSKDKSVREVLRVYRPILHEKLGYKQILDVGCYAMQLWS
jgi:hypothetical protein